MYLWGFCHTPYITIYEDINDEGCKFLPLPSNHGNLAVGVFSVPPLCDTENPFIWSPTPHSPFFSGEWPWSCHYLLKPDLTTLVYPGRHPNTNPSASEANTLSAPFRS